MDDDTARIPLRRRSGEVLWALVDPEDLPLVSGYTWRATSPRWTIYAMTGGTSRPLIQMHRLILNAPPGTLVDHVNGNGLDNRRSNLRLATGTQNQANMRPIEGKSSRYKGVSWQKAKRTWRAQIKVRGVSRRLGAYPNEIDAALAYDAAAKDAFGEFALLNFPTEGTIHAA